jgi:acetyltransferase-like isoleucine patch superfamily enzyme
MEHSADSVEEERALRRFLRPVGVGDAAHDAYDEWVATVAQLLDDPSLDRNDVVRDVLDELYGHPRSSVVQYTLDPRHATLEPEYYRDIDGEKYEPLKPLHWLWIMFDRSPIGRNLHLGVLFRRMLAQRLFRKCGKNVKIFHDVEFTYGYNLEVGDNVVIHRGVLMDDRGGIIIGNNVSISDYANLYSHDHSIVDIGDISMTALRIGDGARITYHATVLAGAHVGEDAIVASHGLLRRAIGPHTIAGGVPAKVIGTKPEPGKSV